MDIASLYFFTEVAKDLHITKTAERLFISQQTLSNHIARLERYYGTKLMSRMPEPALTYAGELVLDYAKQVCGGDANLLRQIAEVKDASRGSIKVGASAMRATTCLPDVLPVFYERYPHVSVSVVNTTTPGLEKLVAAGEVDFAITVDASAPGIDRRPLGLDQVYLCFTETLLRKVYGEEAEAVLDALDERPNLRLLSELPYCMLDNRVADYVTRAFRAAGYAPFVSLTVSNIRIGAQMAYAGVAASFLTKSYLATEHGGVPGDLRVYPLCEGTEPLALELTLAYQPERYQPAFARELAALIERHYASVGAADVEPARA